MPEKFSTAAQMRALIRKVAGPKLWSDTQKTWLSRAARRARISYRQAKALNYGEITDPYHRSARLMADAATNAARFEQIASAMRVVDADFFHADIAAWSDASRQYRARYGAGERGEDDADPPRHRR